MTDKMKDLSIRTASGVVMGVAMLGAICWSPWSYGALLLLIAVAGINEFYTLTAREGAAPQRLLGTLTGVLLIGINFAVAADLVPLTGASLTRLGCALAFLVLLFPTMCICELYRRQTNPAAAIAATVTGVLYVALPLAMLCYVPAIGGTGWRPQTVVAYLFIVWANDVFAYLVGMLFGRRRLFERLSPKKSWEGFFGGVAGAVVVGLAAARLLGDSYAAWGVIALLTATTAVLGDLTESMFKRAAGVKDSGRIIPGHGGVLDRFDALLLSAPFVVICMCFIL